MRIKRRDIRFIFTTAVTAGIFIFLFRRIPLTEVLNAIKEANFGIVLLTLGISIFGNILIPAYRWKLILNKLNCSISLKDALFIKMGSDSLINILPFRTGEFSRILYLKRLKKISYSKSVSSIISEYLLNILIYLFFITLGGIIYLSQVKGLNLSEGAVLSTLYLVPVVILPGKFNFSQRFRSNLYKKYYIVLKRYLEEFRKLLRNRSILSYTFLFGALELINVYLLAKAVGVPLSLYRILIFVPLVIFAGNIPITIAGLGVREGAVIFFFSRFASPGILFSVGILHSFVEYLFPMIMGAGLTGLFLNKIFREKLK